MNILVRLLSALAEVNPAPSALRASVLRGETRVCAPRYEWDFDDALAAVEREFDEGFTVRAWFESSSYHDMVFAVRERQ